MVGLAKIGTFLSASSKVSTTLAIEACANKITSTLVTNSFKAAATISSCLGASPLINASKAPSHNTETNSISLSAFSARRSTKSLVGPKVVGSVAITPILYPVCTAKSAIGWSTRKTETPVKASEASTAEPIEEQVTMIKSAPAASAEPT